MHQITSQELVDALNDSENKLIIVDFYADWCGPCKRLEVVLSEFAQNNPHIFVAKIDVDESTDIVQAMEVTAIPTIIFFYNGIEHRREIGVMTLEGFNEIVSSLLRDNVKTT